MVGGGSPLAEQEKLADWPGTTTTSTGCKLIEGALGGAGVKGNQVTIVIISAPNTVFVTYSKVLYY